MNFEHSTQLCIDICQLTIDVSKTHGSSTSPPLENIKTGNHWPNSKLAIWINVGVWIKINQIEDKHNWLDGKIGTSKVYIWDNHLWKATISIWRFLRSHCAMFLCHCFDIWHFLHSNYHHSSPRFWKTVIANSSSYIKHCLFVSFQSNLIEEHYQI